MSSELRQVDAHIWRACAGSTGQIPTVNSRVYYFPQGHAEHSSATPLLSSLAPSRPLVLCRVLSICFLADPDTDEVFARIQLQPIPGLALVSDANVDAGNGNGDNAGEDRREVVSFAKVLTPSDANNGGGFSVPRFCADSIFPPLNYQAEPPVQTLSVTDVHGAVWEFRHIYRGTPRRHLLTTGWSKFVNHKKLIAGDSVVFMKNRAGRLFVGVRRAIRKSAAGDFARWGYGIGGSGRGVKVKVEDEDNVSREGFSRSVKCRVSAESVAEAAELAAQGMTFEIVYYPKSGAADFVVRAEMVEASMKVFWTVGVRIKMAMETEDASRTAWFQGTISSAAIPDNGPWQGSPWRMLQVTWDEPEVLQNIKRVSPWQVEYVAPTPSFCTTFPPSKKFRIPQNPGMLNDGEGERFFPMTVLPNTTVGQMSPALLNYNTSPAGMQGARQDPFCISGLTNLLGENTKQISTDYNFGNNMSPTTNHVSTELNIGSSQSENSPDSQCSVHFSGPELVGNQFRYSSQKIGASSIQLFGKIIHTKRNDESVYDDVRCTEDGGGKTQNLVNSLEFPLTQPYKRLFDRLDVQCQGASAVKACFL